MQINPQDGLLKALGTALAAGAQPRAPQAAGQAAQAQDPQRAARAELPAQAPDRPVARGSYLNIVV